MNAGNTIKKGKEGNGFTQLPRKNKGVAGFTLLEVTVATGIFAVLMMLTVSITLGVLNIQRKVGAIQSVIDNTRVSLELMTREMRTGINFSTINLGCPNTSGFGIQFTDVNTSPPERHYYYVDSAKQALMRVAMSSDIAIDCTQTRQFTGAEVIVENIQFILNGAAAGPADGQPRITIFLKGKSKNQPTQFGTSMQLQTTVVPRLRDL